MLTTLSQTFSTVQSCFPRALTPHLTDYINIPTHYLQQIYPVFFRYYVTTGDAAMEPPSSNADDDVESGIPDVACAALDFLTAISRARAKKVFVQPPMSTNGKEEGTPVHVELVSLVLKYGQIKREEEDDWLGDANAFVADDDDEAESYGLRTSGFDLLGVSRSPVPKPRPSADLQNSISPCSTSIKQRQPACSSRRPSSACVKQTSCVPAARETGGRRSRRR